MGQTKPLLRRLAQAAVATIAVAAAVLSAVAAAAAVATVAAAVADRATNLILDIGARFFSDDIRPLREIEDEICR